MPTESEDRLLTIAKALFMGAGANDNEATIIARHLVDSNLAGHDSHGIIRCSSYIQRIKDGHIVPGAPIVVEKDNGAATHINGNWGFGYTVTEYAMDLTIEKAKKFGVAATTVYQQSHVGRLTDYPLVAVKEGMICMMSADSGRSSKKVAPFGGAEPRVGTNPLCIAMPSNLDGPFYFDFATSAGAGGKLEVAISRGEQVPEGWMIDRDGNPTTDPKSLKAGGAILPMGGAEGYKGYALAAMVELLSGVLPGLGFGIEPTGRSNDGVFIACFNVSAFRDLEVFKQEVTEFAEYLTSTPTQPGVERVYYPGQPEHIRAAQKRKDGIFVEDATWAKLTKLAVEYGLADELGMS
jgi:LDH2 family malate/lactate/ureidoglycolate dehydrogenase